MSGKQSKGKKATKITAAIPPSKILLKSLRGKHITVKLTETSPT